MAKGIPYKKAIPYKMGKSYKGLTYTNQSALTLSQKVPKRVPRLKIPKGGRKPVMELTSSMINAIKKSPAGKIPSRITRLFKKRG
jgi:hypothetical protein